MCSSKPRHHRELGRGSPFRCSLGRVFWGKMWRIRAFSRLSSSGLRPVALLGLSACALWALQPTQALAGQAAGSQSEAGRVLIDSAYSALDSGDLGRARDLAERALKRSPNDPEALMARGRVYLAWPRVGRFRALRLFRRAAQQVPRDPEPQYWIGRTGLALLGDDGEAIARRGLERSLALDPLYRDAWELWGRLYRSPKERARMVEILRPHGDSLTDARAWIAGLWVENGACELADLILQALERELPGDVRWPAWRAECAFVDGRDGEGREHYERALALADRDSDGVLWAQIASITAPEERAAFNLIPPQDRETFYRAFWAPRDPNIRTPENERIAEHFRRRTEARDRYRLLHPLSLYHYSLDYRNRVSRVSSTERERYMSSQIARGGRIAEALSSSAGLTSGERLFATVRRGFPTPEIRRILKIEASYQEPDLTGTSPEIMPLGRNLPEMMDDRGLAFIRHGPPDRIEYRTPDAEEWVYDADPPLKLRFARGHYPPDPPLPDMIYRPMTAAQMQSIDIALTTDRSSVPAPLEFEFWLTRFRASDDPGSTELIIVPEATTSATAELFDGAGRKLAHGDAASGLPVRVTSSPGRLLLALDVERSDSLGRYRGTIELPDFGTQALSISDVLIARASEGSYRGRDEAVKAAIPSLTISTAQPFALYFEIYELKSQGGVHQYELTYEFERTKGWLGRVFGGREETALRFERLVPSSSDGRTIETLQVESVDLAPGSYKLRVQVRDLLGRQEAATTVTSIRLR